MEITVIIFEDLKLSQIATSFIPKVKVNHTLFHLFENIKTLKYILL